MRDFMLPHPLFVPEQEIEFEELTNSYVVVERDIVAWYEELTNSYVVVERDIVAW